MTALQTLLLLMLAALLSSGSAVELTFSSSSSSSSTGHDGSLMQDEPEQSIEQALDKLAHQMDSALGKLDRAAEIDIGIVFDAASSGSWGESDDEVQYDDDDDEAGDEWVVVVPQSEATTGVHGDDLEAAAKADPHVQHAPSVSYKRDVTTADASALAPLRAETDEWTAFFPPFRWHDEFDYRSRQQLNAVPLSALAAMSCVTLGIVASVWWLERRARRRRNLERHEEWVASVEYMDAMELRRFLVALQPIISSIVSIKMNSYDGDSDDGFGDFLGEGEEEWTMQAQEMAALERSMKTAGIRDGIEFGKEDTLQEGFDHGFAAGAASSYRFSVVRGALSAAKACGLLETLSTEDRTQCDEWINTLHQHAMQSAFASNGTQQQTEHAGNGGYDAEKGLVKAQELLERLHLAVRVEAPVSTKKPSDTIE
uniref:Essential protein Yae1 N-terminal domain-containing protein n=1 Tax=Globisporangium ultimum (strain ATCC 200006 / CBS 805.95 / DAOM BR144) TaxID=431595 RepID=K3X9F4_GLOUD